MQIRRSRFNGCAVRLTGGEAVVYYDAGSPQGSRRGGKHARPLADLKTIKAGGDPWPVVEKAPSAAFRYLFVTAAAYRAT